jgi:hypothetical protein
MTVASLKNCPAPMTALAALLAASTSHSGTRGVHGGEDEVPGLGGIQGEAHDLGLAHLADHQDIRVLAHGVEQALREGGRVAPDLTLADERLAWAQFMSQPSISAGE